MRDVTRLAMYNCTVYEFKLLSVVIYKCMRSGRISIAVRQL